MALNISVTPKVHLIFEHIVGFIEHQKNIGNGIHGLGIFSEQAGEACHREFLQVLENFTFPKSYEIQSSAQLCRAICLSLIHI